MKFVRAAILSLTVGNRRVRAQATRGGNVLWSGEAAYESPDELAEVVAQLATAPSEPCRRLNVTLEQPPSQTRILTDLPPVRKKELRSVVANQAGRFFRRNGTDLLTDAVCVITNEKRRVTHAAAVHEPLVCAVLSGATEAGLVVDSINAAGLSPKIQLLPSTERATRVRALRRNVVLLAIAAGVVWLFAGILFGGRLVVERRAIDAELERAQKPLAALREVRRDMRVAEAIVRELENARHQRGAALGTLARVAGAVPDSAVITSYTWRADGSGVVAGAAHRAGDVIAAIDRVHAVQNPRADGAVVHEALGGRDLERFTIVFGATMP